MPPVHSHQIALLQRHHYSIRPVSIKLQNAVTDDEDVRSTASSISNASSRLDPLLTSFLLRSVHNTRYADSDNENEDDGNESFFTFTDATQAMLGLSTWESSLRKGRLPLLTDFQESVWPEEPLFLHVHQAFSTLALQRLVRRHPEILNSVLLGVVKVVVEFINLQRRGKLIVDEAEAVEDEEYVYEDFTLEEDEEFEQDIEYVALSQEELDRLAESLSSKLSQEWGGVVQGVSLLDAVFGYDHNMLDVKVSRSKVQSAAKNTLNHISHAYVYNRERVDSDSKMESGNTRDGSHYQTYTNV
jgi:hypothetical protein